MPVTAPTFVDTVKAKIVAFLDSPANRTGLGVWAGTAITAALTYAVTKQVPTEVTVLGSILGLVSVVRPDNSVTVTQLEKVVADVTALVTTKSAASLGAVVADAEVLGAELTSTPNK